MTAGRTRRGLKSNWAGASRPGMFNGMVVERGCAIDHVSTGALLTSPAEPLCICSPSSTNTMAELVEAWLAGPNATQFYTRTYPAASPKAVVVFLHGFAEHIGRYTHIHPRLAQNGVAVFAFDLRGFGKTAQDTEKKSSHSSYGKTSWPENFADIEWAIKHVREEYPGVPVFLMGHSMV